MKRLDTVVATGKTTRDQAFEAFLEGCIDSQDVAESAAASTDADATETT